MTHTDLQDFDDAPMGSEACANCKYFRGIKIEGGGRFQQIVISDAAARVIFLAGGPIVLLCSNKNSEFHDGPVHPDGWCPEFAPRRGGFETRPYKEEPEASP
jgi:hypothetical protein